MWYDTIAVSRLASSHSWKPEFFCLDSTATRDSRYAMMPIGDLVRERGEFSDPLSPSAKSLYYIGLEDVESTTGRLLAMHTCAEIGVRSRSKVFGQNDVLYGRLRPSLNKVYLAAHPVAQGICSGEFQVLVPNLMKADPVYLRSIMSSEFVTDLVASRLGGSALPRLPLDQLLNIEVPVPPLAVQSDISRRLSIRLRRHALLASLMTRFPDALISDLVSSLQSEGQESVQSEVLDLSVGPDILDL
jgi:hypothetical protein